MSAHLGGIEIFGRSVRSRRIDVPRIKQVNHYFGVNGNEVLDGGSQGFKTEVSGILDCQDQTTLSALLTSIETLKAYPGHHAFVDSSGRQYDRVRLETFEPTSEVMAEVGSTRRLLRYMCVLHHDV